MNFTGRYSINVNGIISSLLWQTDIIRQAKNVFAVEVSKKNLKLSDRIYHCDNCGNTVDRDYQASVNLMRYYGLTA